MEQSSDEPNLDAGRQRELLEDMIKQCDALIDELYETIELFTLDRAFPDDEAMHTNAAQELVYYTRKRIELVDAIRLLGRDNASRNLDTGE
ncbi:hypothetical protein GO730_07715 [Spirosoma sp. HMF3257]|uniref:Uncharacterized protein n=1 Tax=Spirosoma telluris TaxID=2183553 RepID=A0A327NIR9_9BACT|nr:hypothetical protein [Spirosoma telluris]RAI74229.1 hypothetical protein HMF3257_07635 [Spirosoma telluris]